MRPKRDLLFSIFEKQLHSSMLAEETEEVLVQRVVATYVASLKTQGFVPPKYLQNLTDDLREEVTEMYRKKTYGHMELASYRKKHLQKTEPQLKTNKESEKFSKIEAPHLRQLKKQKAN